MCIVHSTSMMSSTIVAATTTDMTVKLRITLPKPMIQKIDQKRGDIPRSRYIRRLGFDNSLHQHHTDEFKTGYTDGYQAGFDDAQLNVFKNPC
jgi:hypothetical protein